jgi:hypothetical protein
MEWYKMAEIQGREKEKGRMLACNEKTAVYGLSLTEEEAGLLLAGRKTALKENRRVEFGEGILPDLMMAFCDSPYISQADYADTLARLQDMFYRFKNETDDKVPDEALITFMRKCFDEICFGSLDYLEGTCLARFARCESLSEEVRWDFDLYWETLKENFS